MANELPRRYRDFITRFPKLGQAWELTREGAAGPLSSETVHLIKLAIAIGALREGAVHSSVRKAIAAGISREAIEQVIALAATTLGFPATVAAYSWTSDILDKPKV